MKIKYSRNDYYLTLFREPESRFHNRCLQATTAGFFVCLKVNIVCLSKTPLYKKGLELHFLPLQPLATSTF